MKGFSKGVNFKTSATKHFAEGGTVRKPRGGGVLGQVAAKIAPAARSAALPRPAPAAGARGVPGHSAKPLIGRGSALQRAKGGAVCSSDKMKSVAKSEVMKHVSAPAPKGHKGLKS